MMESPAMIIEPEELDKYIDQQNRALWAILNLAEYEGKISKNG